MMASMDRNSLTALLTALAIVPLYFKESSQPGPEKWEYASLEYRADSRFFSVRAYGRYYSSELREDGKWEETTTSILTGPSEPETLKLGKRNAELNAENFYLIERQRLSGMGFQPFAVNPSTDPWLPNIFFRRRVE